MTTPGPPIQAALDRRYSIERELGRGGMATVYLARDLRHDRFVALKVLRPDLAAALGAERFAREIKLAAALQHPHIVSVYDSGATADGQLWFTMPYVEGESLRARLEREKQLPIEDALQITREVADALDDAHRHGIVHRDIKPENILLSRRHAMVADFGVALGVDGTGTGGQALTETGVALGTPTYMSPEQATGERTVDARADEYALGCVLYEMLAGEPPYTGATTQALLAKRVSGDIPSVRRVRPAVPHAVDAALTKSLAPVPADRYPTAAEFARALDVSTGMSTTSATIPSPGPVTGRFPVRVVVLGLAVCIGAGFLFAWRHRESATSVVAAGPVGVAVLPFDNNGDTANAYFADGIAGEIRGKLSALPGLRVIATTSSNQYRHTLKAADQVGRELGVRYLLTGTVEWEQGAAGARRVRVSPELVEVHDGAAPETKWRQSFDTTLADVFDVQAAVATRVADKLGLVLSAPAQTQLAARPTQNLAAYDAYLRSVALGTNDPATIRQSLAAAEQAVALDSTFAAAWARVSTRHTTLYSFSVPTSADAEAASRAAERAVALAPAAPDGYMARGIYNLGVAHNLAAGRAAFQTALRLAPSSSAATGGLAFVEAAEGQWTAALEHSHQAVALDPRSAVAAANLSRLLLWLRRYPEARAEADNGLTLAPADLRFLVDHTASLLGDGDLAGAKAGLRDISPAPLRAAFAAYIANYWDLYWALDSTDRALVLTAPPTAFDDDRGIWGLVRAKIYWLGSDTVRARLYADSARIAYETQLRETPDDNRLHLHRGLALAFLGQHSAAVREGERGLALAQETGEGYLTVPYARHVLARIYVAVGDHPRALDQIDSLLAKPYFISPAWLRIDPTWAPLRGDPRFERLLTQPAVTVSR